MIRAHDPQQSKHDPRGLAMPVWYSVAGLLGLVTGVVGVLFPLGLLLGAGAIIGVVLILSILRDPFFGVLCIAFFLPFERVGGMDVGGMSLRIHQVLALITLGSWIFTKLVHGKLRFKANPLFWPLYLYMLVNVLSLTRSFNLRRGFLVLGFTVFVWIVSMMVAEIVDHRDRIVRVVRTLFISATLVSIFGLFQFVGDEIGLSPQLTQIRVGWYDKNVIGLTRLHSTALEPLYFCNYLLVVFPLLISLILNLNEFSSVETLHATSLQVKKEKNRPQIFARPVLIGMAMVMGLAYILTVSRGGYLGLLLSVVVIGFISFKKVFTPRLLILALIALVGVASLSAVTGASSSKLSLEYIQHRATTFIDTMSDWERLETYEAAINAFRVSPYLGFGPGNFGPYVVNITHGTPDNGWGIVNNEPLEMLAEVGLIGFLLFLLAMTIWALRNLAAQIRAQDSLMRALLIGSLASFAGIALQYMTFSTLYIMHVWFMIGFGIALQNYVLSEKTTEHHTERT
ncbi:hypothetical protein AUK40_00485 [Candidatus Wirthbacteria bacterium CG2_30_54_11]|uniref:O-antigen ligase-related domain-containing protein n=1 Tax=Candidatus Wirthbacteria bacterium CG2_30_54_11 TaxID=1817892 RepID=A0A1J5J2R4_9BACT|nr:MAG: hypothetical protein AUK40_00485 [Candidatus Wirthbacteria bacterium CG2_30_54_11]